MVHYYFSYPNQGLLNFKRRDDEKEQLCNGGTHTLGQEAQTWAKALFWLFSTGTHLLLQAALITGTTK